MIRRSHHGQGDDYITLTNWKCSNFIVDRLIKGWNIRYYSDTDRIHYWKGDEYRIVDVSVILNTKTGLEYD
nr:MAG TPA: hypothetical protein [Caudoviricetes sp.]